MKTLFRSLKKALLITITVALVLATLSPLTAHAIEIHEDPEQARVIFNAISLFRYYSDSLDLLLKKVPDEVEARLKKMPFANVPEGLSRATGVFASSSTNLSYLVFDIDRAITKLMSLARQSRFDEAAEFTEKILASIVDSEIRLNEMEQAISTIGRELRISSASPETDLRRSFDEVTDRIEKIRAMLAAYRELVANIPAERQSKQTQLTFNIVPATAFVGDAIAFEGELTSEKRTLASRDIVILLDSSEYAAARTDGAGHFAGTLPVPYRYQPEMELQALYYPKDGDAGIYSAALSPGVKLKVLFYEALLKLDVPAKSYPGLETIINGRFDYGQATAPAERTVEIYLDDGFLSRITAQENFSTIVKIPPETLTGKHTVTFSAGPLKRYAPVTVSATLNVTKAVPVLVTDLPGLVIIPGSMNLNGRLSSEIGALGGASVKMKLGGSEAAAITSVDGSFDVRMAMGLHPGLAGWQSLEWEITPQEPWHAPLSITGNLFTVNVINSGSFIVIIALLGVYLPRQLRKKFGLEMQVGRKPAVSPHPTPSPQTAATNSQTPVAFAIDEASQGPRGRILGLYRLVLGLLQRLTKTLLPPQQTLREFADSHSKALGPFARHFLELSRTVERLLYSRHQPTEEEVRKSEQLTHDIREAFKGEGI
ncbi:MAG: DUF4129 domain-containing protein [Chloroflexi bacterium]|nr:DUF4129 domain-containing protein [Chloroflexota bacterium]